MAIAVGIAAVGVAAVGVAAVAAVAMAPGTATATRDTSGIGDATTGGGPTSTSGPGGMGVEVVDVTLRAGSPRDVAPLPVVDGLAAPLVLEVRAHGFAASEQAAAMQCVRVTARVECGNRIPVRFGPFGEARFQYLVTDDVGPDGGSGRCTAADPPCVVAIVAADGRRRAELQTVFGALLPPDATASVEPDGPLAPGRTVRVQVDGLHPATDAVVTTCVAPVGISRSGCGAPAPVAEVVVGSDGTARAEVEVTRGPVGDQRLSCDDDHACALVVLADRADARVAPIPVRFAPSPGAAYDPVRLGAGLAAATLVLLLAASLVVRTDWSPIGDAAAPEIDEAAYADLDAIIAALPPDEERRTDA